MIDEINKNHKKRYQVRHVLEHEYKERDIQDQQRAEARLLARHKYDDMIKKYDKGTRIVIMRIRHLDALKAGDRPYPEGSAPEAAAELVGQSADDEDREWRGTEGSEHP